MALEQTQVTIIQLACSGKAARLEVRRRHRAGGGEAHPGALGADAVALAEVGHRQDDPLIERAARSGALGF